MRLPGSIKSLCSIERITVKKLIKNTEHNFYEVISADGREFVVFSKKIDAFNYAVSIFVEHETDPQILGDIRRLKTTRKKYAEALVEREDVPSIISYDQYHKVRLPKNALAYRTL